MAITKDTYIGNVHKRTSEHPEEFIDATNLKHAVGAILRSPYIEARTFGELIDEVGLDVGNWLVLNYNTENPSPAFRYLGPAKLQALFSQLYADGVIDEYINVWDRISDFYHNKGEVSRFTCRRFIKERDAKNSSSNMEAHQPD